MPLRLPLKFPLSVKPPLAVVLPCAKQGFVVVTFRFVTDTELSLFWNIVMVNAKFGEPFVPVRVAVQFPLTLLLFEFELLPQPAHKRTSASVSSESSCLMGSPICLNLPTVEMPGARSQDVSPALHGLVADGMGSKGEHSPTQANPGRRRRLR